MELEFKEHLESYLNLFSHLNAEEYAFLTSYLQIERYAKKDFLFKSGEVQKEVGQVSKGVPCNSGRIEK